MCECERIMEIGAGGLHRVEPLPEAEVQAEVGAQEAQEAEVGEVEAQGGAVSPRAHHRYHQLVNLLKGTETIQDQGTDREGEAARQSPRRARRLRPLPPLVPSCSRLLSIRSLHIPVQSSSRVSRSTITPSNFE